MPEEEQLQFQIDSDFFGEWPGFGGLIEQTVMPLITVVDGEFRCLGTGFIISPNGLMMTARHVIDEALRLAPRRLDENGRYYPDWNLSAIYTSDEPHTDIDAMIGGPIEVIKAYMLDSLDIALCWLRPLQRVSDDTFLTFPTMKLSSRMPRVDEHIGGFGYYGPMTTTVAGSETVVEWDRQKRTTTGQVVEVHPQGRDSAMLPFPCFRVNTRFEPGMSGGPIMREDGHVCGVICSGMPPTEDDPSYLSYASLVVPAFAIQMEAIISPSTEPENMFLYDYANGGFVGVDDRFSELRFTQNEDGLPTVAWPRSSE